jgi:hypothetical protein
MIDMAVAMRVRSEMAKVDIQEGRFAQGTPIGAKVCSHASLRQLGMKRHINIVSTQAMLMGYHDEHIELLVCFSFIHVKPFFSHGRSRMALYGEYPDSRPFSLLFAQSSFFRTLLLRRRRRVDRTQRPPPLPVSLAPTRHRRRRACVTVFLV